MDRFDPFVKYADVYGDIINWEKDPMNKPQNQNKYFFSDGKTYYEQICKMLRLMSVFKEAFNQIYSNEDEISEAWENFVNNLSASVVEGSEPDVTLTWTDDSVNFEFTMVPGVPGEQGVGITSISFNSDYTMTITLSDGNTYTSMSLKGETGPQGPQGETGSGLQILDVYATLADLQSAHPTGQPGDAYQVGSAGNYILYIWSSSQSAWVQAGTLGTVSPYTSAPLMDGTASSGSQNLYARGDHVHPSDTSRASKKELDALIKTSQSLIDQSFTYRESPAIQDGLARIDRIKGNTLVWNQLVQNGNFSNTSGWSGTRVTLSASNNELTVTVSEASTGRGQRVFKNLGINDTHTRLYTCEIKAASGTKVNLGSNTVDAASYTILATSTASGDWQKLSAISSLNHAYILIGLESNTSIGDSYQIRNVQVFDMTQMGLDITASDFTSLFSLPYYSYNQGSLLSFMGNGIKTVGKNLYNLADVTSLVSEVTIDGDAITIVGTVRPVARLVLPSLIANGTLSKTFTLSYNIDSLAIPSANIFCGFVIRKPDGTNRYESNGDKTIGRHTISVTLADGEAISSIQFNGNDSGTNYGTQTFVISKVQLEYGSTATDFEPYTSPTLSLPISTYFPTGMKSAGTVYDELLPTKAITRVGMVDLGTLTWILVNSEYWQCRTGVSDMKLPTNNADPSNVKHSNYATVGGYYVQSANQIGIVTNGYINCNNGSTTDKPSGYLYYELATPVETAVDLDLDFIAYEDGTEQLLPVNGSVPSTSPIIADMTYLSIDDAMEYIIDKLANVPENTQQILDALEDDVADLQTDVGALQPAVSALQTSVGNINTNIGQISSTVAGNTSSISDIQSDISDLNTGLSNLEDTVTDHTSRIGTLETGLATTNGNVQNLETSVSDLDSTVTAQGETVTALDNFVSNIANTRNPGYMSSDNSIGITSAFLNMTLSAGQSTWANIPLPTIMAGFIPLFVVGASTGDGSVCLFKIPSTYNQNNIYKVGVKNTSNSEVTTQVGIEILCIKQRQSQ